MRTCIRNKTEGVRRIAFYYLDTARVIAEEGELVQKMPSLDQAERRQGPGSEKKAPEGWGSTREKPSVCVPRGFYRNYGRNQTRSKAISIEFG